MTFWEKIQDKVLAVIVGVMLTTGGAFLMNSGKALWEIPSTVKELKDSRQRDSVIYMKMWLGRNHYQDSINNLHKLYLEQDFDTLRAIKWKLKRNKIR